MAKWVLEIAYYDKKGEIPPNNGLLEFDTKKKAMEVNSLVKKAFRLSDSMKVKTKIYSKE